MCVCVVMVSVLLSSLSLSVSLLCLCLLCLCVSVSLYRCVSPSPLGFLLYRLLPPTYAEMERCLVMSYPPCNRFRLRWQTILRRPQKWQKLKRKEENKLLWKMVVMATAKRENGQNHRTCRPPRARVRTKYVSKMLGSLDSEI